MRIAVTGHRPNKLNNEYNLNGPMSLWIKKKLYEVIEAEKPTQIISGMALGVDTIWALSAIEHKIPLLAAIPFEGQEKIWPQESKDLFNYILNHPETTKYIVSEGVYAPYKMQIRNKWMVDNCDVLVGVFDGTAGGTKNCVTYANSVNKKTIIIDPKDYRQ